MTLVPCPHCKGTGKVQHQCRDWDMQKLECVYAWGSYPSYERLDICKCKVCDQLWMIRVQFDAGTGHDDIWLKPGESERGYTFDLETARKYGYQG